MATSLSTSAARPWPSAERAYAEASQTTTEAVTSIRTVRALRAEEPTPVGSHTHSGDGMVKGNLGWVQKGVLDEWFFGIDDGERVVCCEGEVCIELAEDARMDS